MKQAASASLPHVLYGLRLAASVCLALYVAFRLELQDPFWAGTSAVLTCQPILGATLRKGAYRMIGTVIGAVFSVVLVACFPQDRIGFVMGLALWGAACAFTNALLENFSAYAAALAGYTAAIIAGGVVNQTDQVFTVAVLRASEICIGVVASSLVSSLTSPRASGTQLAHGLAELAMKTASHICQAVPLSGPIPDTLSVRRELIKRTTALSPLVDSALGESACLRWRARTLHAGIDGLFAALADWRSITAQAEPAASDGGTADTIGRALPGYARHERSGGGAADLLSNPGNAREALLGAARSLVRHDTDEPVARLRLDRAAQAFRAVARTLNALALLVAPGTERRVPRAVAWQHPDLLPPLVNAARVFLVILATSAIWIATAWPDGPNMITFAFVVTILFAPQNETAYATAAHFVAGAVLGALLAAILKFGILPTQHSFAGFSLCFGSFVTALAVLLGTPRLALLLPPTLALFTALLNTTNQETYDPGVLYNSALAIISGCVVAAVALLLVPPLPPRLRASRLLDMTLRDFRRLAGGGRAALSRQQWDARLYGRLSTLPGEATQQQRSDLVTALVIGQSVLRLRVVARRFGVSAQLTAALGYIACGDGARAAAGLMALEQSLAEVHPSRPGARVRLRARGSVRDVVAGLRSHDAYFGSAVR